MIAQKDALHRAPAHDLRAWRRARTSGPQPQGSGDAAKAAVPSPGAQQESVAQALRQRVRVDVARGPRDAFGGTP